MERPLSNGYHYDYDDSFDELFTKIEQALKLKLSYKDDKGCFENHIKGILSNNAIQWKQLVWAPSKLPD
ncbi:hypothetical protein DKK70_01075 [Gilliamella apicola]|uniref:Uncharacterized protein n=1 Tax=Gilliamella apicola TaxID=1196095 RepID=A0A2V4EV46_9GAMM|nr:hypothetical protein DKK70_01075 [Gilliamella apicola]